ncbi:MAG: SpoIVB peptidase [Clostridia bacterium]|nr:SpoIVB peptidase [Clostridia bacterium]
MGKWFFRMTAVVLTPLCALVLIGVGMVQGSMPASFTVNEGEALALPLSYLTVNADGAVAAGAASGTSYEAQVRLFGLFPSATVQVSVEEKQEVAVCGMPFGIKMFTEGVLVVGIGDVDTRNGDHSPARAAGLRVGDSVLKIGDTEVSTTAQVAALIEDSRGKTLELLVRREQVEFTAHLTPVASVSEKRLKAGMWIRDSTAGIGTLTFYDMKTNVFAGLGHPVNDVDTGETVPISSGEVVPADIFGVTRGQAGSPGELLGSFVSGSWGILTTNEETGLYGLLHEQPDAFATLPIACKQEVLTGEAQMITTIRGQTPKAYDIVIESVDYRDDVPTQNLVIRVTDEELLQKTGGVLCGMSGSPIVQNGKLVGAVTHVFVDDPTGGYAIFAQTMRDRAAHMPTAALNNAA